MPVLQPGRGKTKTGGLWVYVETTAAGSTEPPAAWYQYTPIAKANIRSATCANFYRGHPGGCLRRLGQASRDRSPRRRRAGHMPADPRDLYLSSGRDETSIAAQALRRIAELYAIERDIRVRSPRSDARNAKRGRVRLLQDMHAWLSQLLGRVSAKSGWRKPSATA